MSEPPHSNYIMPMLFQRTQLPVLWNCNQLMAVTDPYLSQTFPGKTLSLAQDNIDLSCWGVGNFLSPVIDCPSHYWVLCSGCCLSLIDCYFTELEIEFPFGWYFGIPRFSHLYTYLISFSSVSLPADASKRELWLMPIPLAVLVHYHNILIYSLLIIIFYCLSFGLSNLRTGLLIAY